MNERHQQNNQSLVNTLNDLYKEFNISVDTGNKLYTIVFRFNGMKQFIAGSDSERRAEERVLRFFESVLHRLYARPWKEKVFGCVFFDQNSTSLSGAHAHCLLSINESQFRGRFKEKGLCEFFREMYDKWLDKPDERGNKDLLKSYWIKAWDEEGRLLKYSAKSYEWGGLFYGSSPVYFSGRLCKPRKSTSGDI